MTDARGATMTFSYNGRHLVQGITYGVPAGVAATLNVNIGYDAAGNRLWMTEGLGSVNYAYNQLSRMTSETRTFSGVGSFTLSYQYNLAGELTNLTNPSSSVVTYNYDKIGRLNGMTGSGPAIQYNNAVTWVHQEPLTKGQRITDSSGNVVPWVDLDPLGGETNRSWNSSSQPHRYTTYERDANQSDDAMHRRYDLWWSRFDQPDPYHGMRLHRSAKLQPLQLCWNDPVNFVDPSGVCIRRWLHCCSRRRKAWAQRC